MRKIKVKKWKAVNPDGSEKEESLITALTVLVSNSRVIPKGIEKFRTFARISAAFDKSASTGVLELEEAEYELLKKIVEDNIPSYWALNNNISEAIEEFLKAEEVK